jgi:hypothetical protein
MHRCVAMVMMLALAFASGLWAEQEPQAEPMGPALPVVLNIIPGVGLVGYGVIYAIGQAVAVSLAEVLSLGFADPTVETRTAEAFVFSGLAVWLPSGCSGARRRHRTASRPCTTCSRRSAVPAPGRAEAGS